MKTVLKVVELAAANNRIDTSSEAVLSPEDAGWKEQTSPEVYML